MNQDDHNHSFAYRDNHCTMLFAFAAASPLNSVADLSAPADCQLAFATAGSTFSPMMKTSFGAQSARSAGTSPYLTAPGRNCGSSNSVSDPKRNPAESIAVRSMAGPTIAFAAAAHNPACPTPTRCTFVAP